MFDYLATVGAMVALSIPTFWFGLVVIYIFSVKLGWLPAGNMYTIGDGSFLDYLHHLIAPCLVLALVTVAIWSRYMRRPRSTRSTRTIVRTARAKGLRERVILCTTRAQRAAADDHAGWLAASHAAGRRAGDRDRLHLAGHGAVVPR